MKFKFKQKNKGTPIDLTLKNAVLIPDLRTNLLLVSKITAHRSTVIFDKKEARIVDKNGVTELRAIRENGLHYLTEEQETCKTATNLRKNQKKYWSSMESYTAEWDT